MARQEHQHLYLGRSGQLAVMSELLYRGLNVAMPEVDVGDDVFVVRDEEDVVERVQVKSATAMLQQGGYYAQFSVPLKQLHRPDPPVFVYVFPVRHESRWSDFMVIRRAILNQLHVKHNVGSTSGDELLLRLAFTGTDVQNKGVSFQAYRNVWDPWPPPLA